MNYHQMLQAAATQYSIPTSFVELLQKFYGTYVFAAQSNQVQPHVYEALLTQFLDLVLVQFHHPFQFAPYHVCIRSPIDYYQFGIDFIRPLIIKDKSTVHHWENVQKLVAQLKQGHNVIFLANHQTELDPQVISLLLEESYPDLGEEMIFVAGHRVVNDPMAIPFSKGRNLLCIYSKKYLEAHPDQKEERALHNQRTMLKMSELLSEGGKCIYVAPSGGRDRLDAQGKVKVAPFDPQSVEMFWLMAQRALHPTHFYSLALETYHLLPPPDGIKKELGEARHTQATSVHLAFGAEIDMERTDLNKDKKMRRKERADLIWKQVCEDYEKLRNDDD